MAEMSVTAGTEDLGPDHAVTVVRGRGDILGGYGLEEAGPASARVELAVGCKQRQAAADAGIDALAFVVQQVAAKG
jgi:hypothetical protein